ncbi:uncharacterized protein BXZ73DRAFT_54983 [Epithele typhae]|uniref:uncharacterized protein n=1 Tax=Epithele typhae TaxID=378194 RepID=UPI002007688E|nr:uncharacterized protein BXZ73DRAFT_54983 [Epithele typhae]KAH9914388.1 hypothetical protein BXZ73DRAFT_54983 [Epithele typhae]
MVFQIQSGHTYKLVNTQTRTVLALDMADFRTITGAPWSNADHQKWVAEWPRQPNAGSTTRWSFRSVATGLFLGLDGAGRRGTSIVATRDETEWDTRAEVGNPSALRCVHFAFGVERALTWWTRSLEIPGGRLTLNLTAGVSAKLCDGAGGGEQYWRFEEGEPFDCVVGTVLTDFGVGSLTALLGRRSARMQDRRKRRGVDSAWFRMDRLSIGSSVWTLHGLFMCIGLSMCCTSSSPGY